MQKYFDSHCHLQNVQDLKLLLAAAKSAGICGFICNATKPDDWIDVQNLATNYIFIHGCIGVHPWYIDNLRKDWLVLMRGLLQKHPSLMVGEIGLDRFASSGMELQESVFKTQLELASELNRPVHIHCVGAWDKMLRILKTYKGIVVLHAFSTSVEVLNQLLKKENVFFSYSSAILDCNRQKLLELVQNTPVDRILVESDEKSSLIVIDVVKRIANVKSVAVDKIADTIYKNSLRLIENGQIS